MPYVYLIVAVFLSASANVFSKLFNCQTVGRKDSGAFYNFLFATSVALGWGVVYAFDFSFDVTVLWYAIGFGVCFTACIIGLINAMKYGSAALTSLFVSLSLILTTAWGFVFWNAKFTVSVGIGLALVVLSIVCCLYSKDKERKGFSWKWLFFALLACFGNAACSILQRSQQIRFHGEHGSMLMLFATTISAVVCLCIYLKSDKTDSLKLLKKSAYVPVLAGVCNIASNFLIMLIATTSLSSSLVYPVLGVGSLGVVILFSLMAFKEKIRKIQWLGLALGAAAIALLSV
jgi:drug/metabolite transporter (DMT)-like permease